MKKKNDKKNERANIYLILCGIIVALIIIVLMFSSNKNEKNPY